MKNNPCPTNLNDFLPFFLGEKSFEKLFAPSVKLLKSEVAWCGKTEESTVGWPKWAANEGENLQWKETNVDNKNIFLFDSNLNLLEKINAVVSGYNFLSTIRYIDNAGYVVINFNFQSAKYYYQVFTVID